MITASILNVTLTVLMIIGFVLVGIIALAFLISMAVLFVPVRLKVKFTADKDEEKFINGLIRASWLFHTLNFSAVVEGTKVVMRLRLFGITIKKSKEVNDVEKANNTSKKTKDIKLVKKEKVDEKPLDATSEGELVIEPISSKCIPEEKAEIIEINVNAEKGNAEILDDILDEIEEDKLKAKDFEDDLKEDEKVIKKGFFKKIKDKIIGIINTFKSIIRFIKTISLIIKSLVNKSINGIKIGYDKLNEIEDFINDEENREAYKVAKKEFFFLLKHIKPTKITGFVDFGFEDPAYTGRALGLYYSIFPVSPENFNLTGEFDKKEFKGNVMMRGHIRINHLLMSILRIRKNKKLVELFKKITSL